MPHPTKSPTKTSRALPKRWARLLSLKASETFTHGGERYYKSVFPFSAIDLKTGSRAFFAPWTRVQTDVLVRDARPGGKSSKASYRSHIPLEDANCGEPVRQPNSDNDVSGPTA